MNVIVIGHNYPINATIRKKKIPAQALTTSTNATNKRKKCQHWIVKNQLPQKLILMGKIK